MVDLPTTPLSVPEVRAPQSRVSPAQIASPYNELAANLDKAGDALSKSVAEPLAFQAGLKAVTRDANGNVVIDHPPIVGDAAIPYARAVKVAAVADGETDAKMRNIALRNEHQDDPEGYLKAAGAFKRDFLQTFKAAGPEVQFALGKTVDHLTTETYNGLLNQKQNRDVSRATQSIQAQIATTQNEMYAMANGGDTSSPEFLQRANKIKALYGELVNNPRIAYPKERAEFEISQWDANLRANGIAHNIATTIYDKEGPEAAVKAAEEIRTDTSLNLSPQQREAFYGRAMSAVQQRARFDQQNDKAIGAEIGNITQIASEGYNPSPERLAALKAAVAQSKNPVLTAQYEAAIANMPVVAAWRQMSPVQLESELSRIDKRMREGEGDERLMALYGTGQKLLKTMREQLKADPLGWADRTGVLPTPVIKFDGPTAPDDMKARRVNAEIIAQHYGIAPTYLRPDERRFLEVASAQGGAPMLTMVQNIADGFGDRSSKVLAEVSKDAPILAHMGGLMSGGLFGGGSLTFANDVAEAVALRSNKEFKLPRWLDHPSDKIIMAQHEQTRGVYGDAFTLVPENGRAAEASAQAAYFARANRQGYSALVDDSNSKAAYERALQEGAGATYSADGVQYGGIATKYRTQSRGFFSSTSNSVLVPGNIRADRFKDVIGAIKDEDLKLMPIAPEAAPGKPYTARDLQNAAPVAVRGGYRFAMGDPSSDDPKWLRGADGRPFVLSIEALEPMLRSRVPGAFLGSR